MFFPPGPPLRPEPVPAAVTQRSPPAAGLSLPSLLSHRAPTAKPPFRRVIVVSWAAKRRGVVAQQAARRVGTAARLYYPRRPRIACASFVSKVLVLVGLLPHQVAAVAGLRHTLLKHGWRANCPCGTSVAHVNRKHLAAGDVLFFTRGGCRLQHAGISLGGDRFVAISSSRCRVLAWRLSDYSRVYGHFESFRYAP